MPRASNGIWLLLLALLALCSSLAQAAAPTFCKCTCFKNSTLIQLGPESSSSSTSRSTHLQAEAEYLPERSASASCTQCTRAFCLSHNLPICKDAEESDTVATCFQRDSRKDEIIVWAFILGTTGLLAWAAVKRLSEYRDAKKGTSPSGTVPSRPIAGDAGGSSSQNRGAYAPLDDAESRSMGIR
ncbi:uncharacterized protein B0I36DRAFT_311873 [Microdochium trichocladiopsis]|uniref:AN1-type domain-containing protein n=1 Tax=Microdochium trichocladiopsis TaxID=1682393 RepID=A0A9P9BWW0_9PEZI|nr:uncharacterized protein B0I36DRAFT_311873 [Microdochium trichocladiopsis]KAH7040980.1 hypothetical protein B0I36DRAFT_311873 [Microdochium trichocladiopsis]